MSMRIFRRIRENHNLIMLTYCLTPLIITGALFYFGFKKYAILAVILICPILHYFMMKDIHKKHNVKNPQSKTGGMKMPHFAWFLSISRMLLYFDLHS